MRTDRPTDVIERNVRSHKPLTLALLIRAPRLTSSSGTAHVSMLVIPKYDVRVADDTFFQKIDGVGSPPATHGIVIE